MRLPTRQDGVENCDKVYYAEFALRDTGRSESKKILHHPTNDNFSILFFFYLINKKSRKQVKVIEDLVYFSTDLRIKVARYSFSRPIPPKFEHKLRPHKQSFGKIATTVVLDKDENLL